MFLLETAFYDCKYKLNKKIYMLSSESIVKMTRTENNVSNLLTELNIDPAAINTGNIGSDIFTHCKKVDLDVVIGGAYCFPRGNCSKGRYCGPTESGRQAYSCTLMVELVAIYDNLL